MILDALLCKQQQKRRAKKRRQRKSRLWSPPGSPQFNKKKWWEQEERTPEMQSKQSRRLKESTLIKMLTVTLSIYERSLTLRKKQQHSARAEVTICQVLSRCMQSLRHIARTYVHSLPHMGPLLLQVFWLLWFSCFVFFFLSFIVSFYNKIQLSQYLLEYEKRVEIHLSKCASMNKTKSVLYFRGPHSSSFIAPI